jgi:hypothetical protein
MITQPIFLLQWLQPATVAGVVSCLATHGYGTGPLINSTSQIGVLTLVYISYSCLLHPLARVPGPVLAKFSPVCC